VEGRGRWGRRRGTDNMTTNLSKNLSLLVGVGLVVVDCDPFCCRYWGKEHVMRRGCSITKTIVTEFVQMGFISKNLGVKIDLCIERRRK